MISSVHCKSITFNEPLRRGRSRLISCPLGRECEHPPQPVCSKRRSALPGSTGCSWEFSCIRVGSSPASGSRSCMVEAAVHSVAITSAVALGNSAAGCAEVLLSSRSRASTLRSRRQCLQPPVVCRCLSGVIVISRTGCLQQRIFTGLL